MERVLVGMTMGVGGVVVGMTKKGARMTKL